MDYTKFKCAVCNTTCYLPPGVVDYVHDCHHNDGTLKTDDRQRIKYDDPQWNMLGVNSDQGSLSAEKKKDKVFEQNTPLVTYNRPGGG